MAKRLPKMDEKPQKKQGTFHLEFLNAAQKMAWGAFDQHDVLFLLGAPGSGKTYLSCAFAVSEILNRQRRKIIITRPVVEAGERLGYLPGDFNDKIAPYMLPIYDCIDACVGPEGPQRDIVNKSIEVAPLAFMRGRSLANTELLPTPIGMKPMGEIKIGDYVFGSNGKPTRVNGVYPQGKIPVFEVKFSDHTKSICSKDHLWNTMTLSERKHNKGFTTKTTAEIMECVKTKHQKNHRVPLLSSAVQFQGEEVGIDPYLLGVLLGDGHISKHCLSITTADQEILDECVDKLPSGHRFVYKGKYDYIIQSNRQRNQLRRKLNELGLVGKKSPQKFIPDLYKFNSIECRLGVLQGLLDTDGWICKHRSGKPRIQFCSTSKKLAEDVMFLVRSLGGLSYLRKREFDESDSHEYKGKVIRHVHPSYTVDIMLSVCPFRLKRKADQYENTQVMTKLISSITEYGEMECTCISVEAEDHLYLTDNFIVTHNTFNDSICILDEAQNATYGQLKLFLTRFGTNSKIIITGDPNQSDIHDPALMSVVKKLENVPGIGVINFKANSIVRHPLIAAIVEKLEEKEG